MEESKNPSTLTLPCLRCVVLAGRSSCIPLRAVCGCLGAIQTLRYVRIAQLLQGTCTRSAHPKQHLQQRPFSQVRNQRCVGDLQQSREAWSSSRKQVSRTLYISYL